MKGFNFFQELVRKLPLTRLDCHELKLNWKENQTAVGLSNKNPSFGF